MKKISVLILLMILFLSGCTFQVEVLTPEVPVTQSALPESSLPASHTPQIPAPPVATISATAEPTATFSPPTTDPVFFNARLAESPNDPNQATFFPAGTKAVYAIWDYQNMRAGLVVKRVWYWNGQPWITREEAWDFNKYGANGTIRDISIYDDTTGLNSGVYQLRLYIDNALQPIGTEIYSPVMPWVTFNIGSRESYAGYASPDFQWAVDVFGEKRIVLQGANGTSTEIYTAREVSYVSWFSDSRHFLFVDRDRSGQRPGTTLGIRDDLWLVDVPTGMLHLLYESDTSFAGHGGPAVSSNGRFIASLEGSGFGDACLVDSRLIFFELAGDFRSIRVIKQTEFSGLPAAGDGSIFPVRDGTWQDERTYLVTLDATCTSDESQPGPYLFNVIDQTVTKSSFSNVSIVPGDLGWGIIHGRITDAVTGAPVANATVTCEHHSYTSPATCSGTATTNANGLYAFENIFFHDTDTVKLFIQAPGYQSQEISQSSFTSTEMEVNFSLSPVPE
jgi:hypothetical protein